MKIKNKLICTILIICTLIFLNKINFKNLTENNENKYLILVNKDNPLGLDYKPEGKDSITGYNYEPWHIRYVGKDVAKYIYDNNITLEEYLNK